MSVESVQAEILRLGKLIGTPEGVLPSGTR